METQLKDALDLIENIQTLTNQAYQSRSRSHRMSLFMSLEAKTNQLKTVYQSLQSTEE